MTQLISGITGAVGNTPLVKLQNIVPRESADVYVKLEYFNPTGSYKDRMALALIEEAEKRGDLKPGMTVVEYTGGSTGTSLAWVCATKGYKFKAISSNAFAKEKLQTISLFGADLEIIHSEGGMITPELFDRMKARTDELCTDPNYYPTRQFSNEDAFTGYKTLGLEIVKQMPAPISAFCAAAGTAGMVGGVTQIIKANDPNTKVVILEPASSPVLTKGIKGTHQVEGIGVGYFPVLLHKAVYDEFRAIEEDDARAMTKMLAAKEGIFAGISSGLNVVAALQLAKELGPGHNVVTIACDSGMKYLASGLFN